MFNIYRPSVTNTPDVTMVLRNTANLRESNNHNRHHTSYHQTFLTRQVPRSQKLMVVIKRHSNQHYPSPSRSKSSTLSSYVLMARLIFEPSTQVTKSSILRVTKNCLRWQEQRGSMEGVLVSNGAVRRWQGGGGSTQQGAPLVVELETTHLVGRNPFPPNYRKSAGKPVDTFVQKIFQLQLSNNQKRDSRP